MPPCILTLRHTEPVCHCVKPSNRSFVVCAAFRTAMPSARRRTEEESGTQQQLDYFKQLRHARAWRCYLHYVTSRDLSDRRKGGQACECCPCEASFGTVAVLRQHGRNGLRCARGVCPCEHARFCSFPGKTLCTRKRSTCLVQRAAHQSFRQSSLRLLGGPVAAGIARTCVRTQRRHELPLPVVTCISLRLSTSLSVARPHRIEASGEVNGGHVCCHVQQHARADELFSLVRLSDGGGCFSSISSSSIGSSSLELG